MNNALNDLMRRATQLTRNGQLKDATETLQRALRQGAQAPTPQRAAAHAGAADAARASLPRRLAELLHIHLPGAGTPQRGTGAVIDGAVFAANAPGSSPAGVFSAGSHTHGQLTRAYKLFVPPAGNGALRPLVVMLHGCTQDPDDFAAGTAMNTLALQQGFVVLYPAQSYSANPQRCWNWFKHSHQSRGRGEPALIASLVQQVTAEQRIDPARVYVAGLSAGGAMAGIVAAAYPELFAAVGVHSGLAPGAAGNVGEALAAMQSGAAARAVVPAGTALPTIVFHGDQDHTVHPRNGEQVLAGALVDDGAAPAVERGVAAGGRRFTRSVHRAGDDGAAAEHWLVHGAGHAWAGGHSDGSYTDGSGPDASAEMLRFFFEHPRRAAD